MLEKNHENVTVISRFYYINKEDVKGSNSYAQRGGSTTVGDVLVAQRTFQQWTLWGDKDIGSDDS